MLKFTYDIGSRSFQRKFDEFSRTYTRMPIKLILGDEGTFWQKLLCLWSWKIKETDDEQLPSWFVYLANMFLHLLLLNSSMIDFHLHQQQERDSNSLILHLQGKYTTTSKLPSLVWRFFSFQWLPSIARPTDWLVFCMCNCSNKLKHLSGSKTDPPLPPLSLRFFFFSGMGTHL